ncbi:MAG: polysaccharide pyruvyl transferase family protein [Verrucomicrobiales bacterium]|nr:polysaccharide pyruvyl transferase family protein [Verrucomicrobiales bacterium]
MKIVITGITSFRNRGVEALVTTSIEQLRPRLPDTRYLVFDRMPEYDASRMSAPDVEFKLDETIRPLYASRLRRTLLQLSDHVEALGRQYQASIRDVEQADAVMASGGDVFCSEYGHQSLLSHLRPLRIAQRAKVPVFIHAQSIGPFKNEPDRRVFVEVAQQVRHITVRERMTHRYLTEELGLPGERVTLTADPAFLLTPCAAPWREHYHAPPEKPLVALSTSQAICTWMDSDYDAHFKAWRRTIRWLREQLDARVILIPHVQELSSRNDDRILATALMRDFAFDPHLQLAGGDFGAGDFKGIISRCDLVIAERMHAAIAGLSSGVPTVVIGYSVKSEGILGDLFDPAVVQDSVLIPLPDFLGVDPALQRISRAWDRREEIAAGLQQRLPEVRERAGLSFDVIRQALIGGG